MTTLQCDRENPPYSLQNNAIVASPFIECDYDTNTIFDRITGKTTKLRPNEFTKIATWGTRDWNELLPAEKGLAKRMRESGILLDSNRMRDIKNLMFQTVDIEIAGTCNAECIFCPREALRKGRGVGIMRREWFYQAIDKIIDTVEVLAFVGIGEPTLNRHLPEFIAYAKARKTKVVLVTNGSLMTESLANKILAAGVDHIQISFTGTSKESYESHMLNLNFDHVKSNVERLIEISAGQIPIAVSAVKTNLNAENLENYNEMWSKKGAVPAIIECHSRGNTISGEDLFTQSVNASPVTKAENRCGLFNSRSFITWQTDVLSCCHDIKGESNLGRLKDIPADEIVVKKLATIDQSRWWSICNGCDEPVRQKIIDLPQTNEHDFFSPVNPGFMQPVTDHR